MATRSTHNKNNSAVKRIMSEARELANDPSTDYVAAPLEEDIFEWHCTIRGSPGTEFEGGLYHVRVLLPGEYPFRPPSIMLLTPNGRFELNTKICISFTNYHEELWQPAWGVRTAIIGLQGFFPLKGKDAVGVGAIEYPTAERKRLAALSRNWTCPDCGRPNVELLPDPPAKSDAEVESTTPQPQTTDVVEQASASPAIVAHVPVPAGPMDGHHAGDGRPAQANLAAITASMTPFAPQAVIPQQQQRDGRRRQSQLSTQAGLAIFDVAIGFVVFLFAFFLARKVGLIKV